MKKLLYILLMLLVPLTINAQVFKAQEKHSVDTTTTYTYEISNKAYKVYKSKRGAFYIWKISKNTGKPYKMYLPKEVQIKMGRKYNISK